MSKLPLIPLETGWRCDYFESDPDLFELTPDAVDVPYLSDWACTRRFAEGWLAWLQRSFDLEPAEVCIRYVLRADSLPEGTQVFVNGHAFGEVRAPWRLDVTDHVMLEDNIIALRVACGVAGQFNGLRLQAVPCP